MINEPNNSPILQLILLDPALTAGFENIKQEAADLLQAHAYLHTIGAQDTSLHTVCIARLNTITEEARRAVASILN